MKKQLLLLAVSLLYVTFANSQSLSIVLLNGKLATNDIILSHNKKVRSSSKLQYFQIDSINKTCIMSASNSTDSSNITTLPSQTVLNSTQTISSYAPLVETVAGHLITLFSNDSIRLISSRNTVSVVASKNDEIPQYKQVKDISGYTIQGQLSSIASNPVLSKNYIVGMPTNSLLFSGDIGPRISIMMSGTITKCYIDLKSGITGGNVNSSFYIRVNNTYDSLITSTLNWSNNGIIHNTSLNIHVNAGDYIEGNWHTPATGTTPGTTTLSFILLFKPD